VTDREVLAFDLHGTLVDPIAISGELDRVLGASGGREVARLPGEQARQLTGLYDELPPFPDAVPALRALAGLGYELAVFSNGSPRQLTPRLVRMWLGTISPA
jgi:FMN phosphatase YigB (HAD superfamily)